MKRYLLTLLLSVVFVAPSTFAQKNDVYVSAGDSKILLQPSTAVVEFDYSNTKVGKCDDGIFVETQPLEMYLKGRGDDFVNDWPDDHVTAENYFIENFQKLFAKKVGGMSIVEANSSADFKIVVHVDNLDMGNAAAAALGVGAKSGGAIFRGSIEIVNLKTNQADCVFEGLTKGVTNYSEVTRLGLAYLEIPKAMRDLANKGASKGGSVAPKVYNATDVKADVQESSATQSNPSSSNNPNVIVLTNTIPQKFKIEDNIIFDNSTPYMFSKVVVYKGNEEVATANDIAKGKDIKIKSYRNDELENFRGATLTINIESEQAVSANAELVVEFEADDDDLIIKIIVPKKKK